MTLLELAYQKNHLECFQLLLAHGASVLALDEQGLPLAHRVLTSGNVLFSNELRIHFYYRLKWLMKQLVSILKISLEKEQHTDAEFNRQITRAIESYQETLHAEQIKSQLQPLPTSVLRKINEDDALYLDSLKKTAIGAVVSENLENFLAEKKKELLLPSEPPSKLQAQSLAARAEALSDGGGAPLMTAESAKWCIDNAHTCRQLQAKHTRIQALLQQGKISHNDRKEINRLTKEIQSWSKQLNSLFVKKKNVISEPAASADISAQLGSKL